IVRLKDSADEQPFTLDICHLTFKAIDINSAPIDEYPPCERIRRIKPPYIHTHRFERGDRVKKANRKPPANHYGLGQRPNKVLGAARRDHFVPSGMQPEAIELTTAV